MAAPNRDVQDGQVSASSPGALSLPGGVSAVSVSAGDDFSLAVGSDGDIYSWGDNRYGELGDGTTTDQSTPEKITLPGGVTALSVSAGNDFSLAVGSDGDIYAWGDNGYGELGDGTTWNQSTPEKITLPGGVSATSVSAGFYYGLAVGSDGDIYAWGENYYGQLGDGTTTDQSTPEKVTLPGGVSAVSVSAGGTDTGYSSVWRSGRTATFTRGATTATASSVTGAARIRAARRRSRCRGVSLRPACPLATGSVWRSGWTVTFTPGVQRQWGAR